MASYEQNKSSKLWSVRFREVKDGMIGQKRLSGFKRKKDAEEAYNLYLQEQRLKTVETAPPEKILFNDMVELFLKSKEGNIKYSSYYALERQFAKNIKPYFEGKYIQDVTPFDINEWQRSISHLKFNTRSNLRARVAAIYKFAYKYYDIKDIMPKTEELRNLETPKEIQYWTLKEFQTFIKVIEDPIYKTFFSFLYLIGTRKGEALALKWEDIDFEKKTVHICKNVTNKTRDIAWEITTTKNRSSTRTVSVPDNLITMLKTYKAWQEKQCESQEFIFCGSRPLPEKTIMRTFQKYIEKAKVKKIRIHDLRHSCASLLISEGATIVAVANRLGHSNIEQTLNTYSHIMPKDEEIILKVLDRVGTF